MNNCLAVDREIELKFDVTKDQLDRLRDKGVLKELSISGPKFSKLRSVYYDTPCRLLKSNGISLRIRQIGDRWVQTLKAGQGVIAGLSQPVEIERPVANSIPELENFGESEIAVKFEQLLEGAELEPVFETVVERTTNELQAVDGSRIEVAFDAGTLEVGNRKSQIHEVELELKSGRASSLFRVAQKLATGEKLRFSTMTKSERGYDVVDGEACKSLRAQRYSRPVLKKNCATEEAFSAIMRACAGQIAHNWKVILDTTDIEGPHQLRVGLRRFRSSLAAFKSISRRKRFRQLKMEARAIAALVGELRDMDVLCEEIVAVAIDKRSKEKSLVALQEQLNVKRQQIRKMVESELASDRMVLFLLRLGQMIEAPKWRAAPSEQQMAVNIAATSLDKSWTRVVKWGGRIETLSIPERHTMRKALKRLRYQVEAFETFYPNRKTKPFLKKLKNLQDIFGYLNDVAMAEKLQHLDFHRDSDADDLQRAISTVLSIHVAQAKRAWKRAQRSWNALEKSGPFWVQ